jgi:hypothetical protein
MLTTLLRHATALAMSMPRLFPMRLWLPTAQFRLLTARSSSRTIFITKAGVCAMTIDNPPLLMNGATLKLVSTTANAHTLTYTAGFGGGTTSRDVATWGGAINDSLTLEAYNGVWWISSTRNVSVG